MNWFLFTAAAGLQIPDSYITAPVTDVAWQALHGGQGSSGIDTASGGSYVQPNNRVAALSQPVAAPLEQRRGSSEQQVCGCLYKELIKLHKTTLA